MGFVGSVYLFGISCSGNSGGCKRGKVYFVDVSRQMACAIPA